MNTLFPPLLLTLLLALTGCEQKGPAADIGDNIDQVVENTERPAETRPPAEARPDPEVLEQQKQEFEQVVQEATREAEDRLGDIMESTLASE
ncbi:hypothetical protein [Zobellella taiwanensis]|jgi:hypothetical protein|uniref:Uncharacterized protein n=1 Tax=Zobellella taiwanensis TaxID=347535 RepID=A0A2P7R104_9GAMM|nr:hypothetical protein [Zobellella taiwanensis]PSJ43888.1 hypothetical protein C7I36_08155 [Zobellella taiwanensis]